jgi:hypothetical protein
MALVWDTWCTCPLAFLGRKAVDAMEEIYGEEGTPNSKEVCNHHLVDNIQSKAMRNSIASPIRHLLMTKCLEWIHPNSVTCKDGIRVRLCKHFIPSITMFIRVFFYNLHTAQEVITKHCVLIFASFFLNTIATPQPYPSCRSEFKHAVTQHLKQ